LREVTIARKAQGVWCRGEIAVDSRHQSRTVLDGIYNEVRIVDDGLAAVCFMQGEAMFEGMLKLLNDNRKWCRVSTRKGRNAFQFE
jgi:hypothetical protein